jgi:PAS domain S-box-containing protein
MSADELAVGSERMNQQALELAAAPADAASDPTGTELLDRITRVAGAVFDVPMVAVTSVADGRHAVKLGMGLPDGEPLEPSELHTVTLAGEGTLVVADAADDARFAHDRWVTGRTSVRFYAGHPLHSTTDGQPIGTLSIMDAQPRRLSSQQLARLEDLALWTQEELGRAARSEALDYLRRSRSWLRTIMDSINEAVVSFNDTGTIHYANAAAEAAFGFDPGGLMHQSIVTLIDGIDWEWAAARVGLVPHEGEKSVIGQRLELPGRRRDGELFPLEVVVTEAHVNAEAVFVAIGRDLTDSNRADAALRESDSRFRTIFEGAGTGIAVTTLDGRLVDVNPTLAEMLGYSVEELLELDPSKLMDDPESRAQYEPLLESLLDSRQSRYRRELRLRRRDGSEMWASATVSAVPGPEEGSILVLVMVSDISQRKEVERLKDDRDLQHRPAGAADQRHA